MLFKPFVIPITFTGSAQSLVSSSEETAKRFVVWASVEAHEDNANRCYIGDASDVSSTNYSSSLAANEQLQIGGPEYAALGGAMHGRVDLNKHYIIGTADEMAMLTVYIPDEE